jgi:hypothetical protein
MGSSRILAFRRARTGKVWIRLFQSRLLACQNSEGGYTRRMLYLAKVKSYVSRKSQVGLFGSEEPPLM